MNSKFTKNEIDEFHIEIGKRVKEERNKKGMTQLELSLSMGYKSVSLVSAAEVASDGKHFNLEHLYKISKVLDISIHNLIPDI
jgi:transcriptional regulator with XRE-family HTH domain